MSFRSGEPYLGMMGGKIDPIREIRNAGIVTSGDVYWVKKPTDPDYVTVKDRVGSDRLRDDFTTALSLTTDDHNDYILGCPGEGGTAFELTAAVDVNKARVHLISVGYSQASHGYSNTLQGFAGATSMDDELVHVTAEGCEIAGFRLLGTAGTGAAGTFDNGLLYLSGSAHNLWVHDCEIENIGSDWSDTDPTGLVASAASQHGARFDNCMIGGTVAETSGTQTPVVCSASGKRWEFHDCKFMMIAGNTGQKFAVAGTGLIDYTLFDRCQFINTDQGNLVASAITGNVTDDEGVVLVNYCTGVNVTAFGTDDNCWVAPNVPGTAGLDVGITNIGLGVIGTAPVAI